jgi:predicted nucleic acid-binding protein
MPHSSLPNASLIDANVILRYLLADHPDLHARAKALLDDVRVGHRTVIVTEAVVAECVYVMQRLYRVPRAEAVDKLGGLLAYRGIAGADVPVLRRALAVYGETNLSFADTLLAARAQALKLPVTTFDEALKRFVTRKPSNAQTDAEPDESQ